MNQLFISVIMIISLLNISDTSYVDEHSSVVINPVTENSVYVRAVEGIIIRKSTSSSSEMIDVVPYGQSVTVLDSSYRDSRGRNSWTKIRWNDSVGWVFSTYLTTNRLVPFYEIEIVAPTKSTVSGRWYSFPPFLADGYIFTTENLCEGDPLCYPTTYNYSGEYSYSGFEYYESGTWRLSGITIFESGEAGFFEPGSYSVQYNISLYRLSSGIYIMERYSSGSDGELRVDFLVKSNINYH